jgi:predicted aminopeptidase
LATRTRLAAIYQQPPSESPAKPDLLALKALAMEEFRTDYQRLKAQWGGHGGYDEWVAQANNAAFGAQAAYDEWVPGFEALFAREGQDWPRFFQAVQALAQKPPLERRQLLNTLNHAKKGS